MTYPAYVGNYTHDSDVCEYIGDTINPYGTAIQPTNCDLYAHFSHNFSVTLVIRYGDDGPDYTSCTFPLKMDKMLAEVINRPEWSNALRQVIGHYTSHHWPLHPAGFIEYARSRKDQP